ncbi:hypothetical protein AMJ48_03005 [Parcubacteria bacterium DG_74_1]|nr:MAG: hypothetical protein AMJ48_03005 [Parcubacteria bacterium DG_74_1]
MRQTQRRAREESGKAEINILRNPIEEKKGDPLCLPSFNLYKKSAKKLKISKRIFQKRMRGEGLQLSIEPLRSEVGPSPLLVFMPPDVKAEREYPGKVESCILVVIP